MAVSGEPEHVVLLCMNDSSQSEIAFYFYLEHVHRTGNKLMVLHIVPNEKCQKRTAHLIQGLNADMLGLQNKVETKYRQLCKQAKVNYEIETVPQYGDIGPTIVAYLHEHQEIETVVMGKICGKEVGKISHHVLHHGHTPVVLCPYK